MSILTPWRVGNLLYVCVRACVSTSLRRSRARSARHYRFSLETNRLTTRLHPYATQENNNLLRWFHAYVIAHGSSALDAYDAFGARVQAQKMKEKSSTSRTPLKTQTTSPRDASGRGAVSDNDDHSASINIDKKHTLPFLHKYLPQAIRKLYKVP